MNASTRANAASSRSNVRVPGWLAGRRRPGRPSGRPPRTSEIRRSRARPARSRSGSDRARRAPGSGLAKYVTCSFVTVSGSAGRSSPAGRSSRRRRRSRCAARGGWLRLPWRPRTYRRPRRGSQSPASARGASLPAASRWPGGRRCRGSGRRCRHRPGRARRCLIEPPLRPATVDLFGADDLELHAFRGQAARVVIDRVHGTRRPQVEPAGDGHDLFAGLRLDVGPRGVCAGRAARSPAGGTNSE